MRESCAVFDSSAEQTVAANEAAANIETSRFFMGFLSISLLTHQPGGSATASNSSYSTRGREAVKPHSPGLLRRTLGKQLMRK